jgi:hypothetical protein
MQTTYVKGHHSPSHLKAVLPTPLVLCGLQRAIRLNASDTGGFQFSLVPPLLSE